MKRLKCMLCYQRCMNAKNLHAKIDFWKMYRFVMEIAMCFKQFVLNSMPWLEVLKARL